MKKKTKRRSKSPLKKLQKKAEDLWKLYCKTRDRFKCRLCGSQSVIQIHHIFSRKSKGLFLDVQNGLTLCRDCHCKVSFGGTTETEKIRRLIDPNVYNRLYEQSLDKRPFLEWKSISWLEQQIKILEELLKNTNLTDL